MRQLQGTRQHSKFWVWGTAPTTYDFCAFLAWNKDVWWY